MEFLESRLASANEAQLVSIVYEGLIEKLNGGIESIEKDDSDSLNSYISKSRDIIAELVATLRGDSEVASNYKSLYLYLNRLITSAEISKDTSKLEEAISIVKPLHEGWAELGEQMFRESVENGKSTPVVSGMTYGKGYLNDEFPSSGNLFEKV